MASYLEIKQVLKEILSLDKPFVDLLTIKHSTATLI